MIAGLVLAAILLSVPDDEEFCGPFPSWKDLRRDYGARGDGEADDTPALQRALDDLQGHKESVVLYIPAGTYRLTRTVRTHRRTHHESMGISVLGEHPDVTILRWDGPPGGIMFQYDAWYSRISRLTLDGRGRAAVALAYGDRFSTYNETSDMVFKDAEIGMQMGTAGEGQAENAVLRCRFVRCSDAGIKTVRFNSYDIWAWHSVFEDCGYGMFNAAGNFHAYENVFLRSKKADLGTANLMVFSFVGNTSVGSRAFVDFGVGHSWGSPTSITGNRVIDPTGDWAIRLGNGGPYLVADNVIRSRPGKQTPEVLMTWGDQILAGNTYTIAGAVAENGRFRRLDERVVAASQIDTALPSPPPVPPRRARPVIEVLRGADRKAIQGAIDEAARLRGRRPVVHLPAGKYPVRGELVVPPGMDLQLVGDGAAETATVLEGATLRLEGPARAAVRDLCLEGLIVGTWDRPGGRVRADQLNAGGRNPAQKTPAGVRISGAGRADALFRCLQGGSFARTWVDVSGKGAGWARPVRVLTGATGTSDRAYSVSRGGRLVVRSVYHEKSAPEPQALSLRGEGTLWVDATRFSYRTSAEVPLFDVQDFDGLFTLATSLLLPVDSKAAPRVRIRRGSGRTLFLGNLFRMDEEGLDPSSVWSAEGGARAAMLHCNLNTSRPLRGPRRGFDYLESCGTADDGFVRAALEPLRLAGIGAAEPVPEGATNVLLSRLIVTGGPERPAVELRDE